MFLLRTLDLAAMADSRVFPNPKVGALIVHEGRIIGEGFHPYAGGPHAEVVAVNDVKDKSLLPFSTLYVSLEPCCYYGRTPPCSLLIRQHKIPKVVVGSLDPNPKVAGKGVAELREAGVEVVLCEDPSPFITLNQIFFTNQIEHRPFITLKWAETADGYMGTWDDQGMASPLEISCAATLDLAHAQRARHHGILIGRRTAAADNPHLNTRRHYGQDPLRVVLDPRLRLDPALHLFSDGRKTIVLNHLREGSEGAVSYFRFSPEENLRELFLRLYREIRLCSLLVEGGPILLQQLIDEGLADEIYLVRSQRRAGKGISGPVLPRNLAFDEITKCGEDWLYFWKAPSSARMRKDFPIFTPSH